MREIYHPPVKRSVEIAGHKTSISLEPLFWDVLRAAAERQQLPLNALIARTDANASVLDEWVRRTDWIEYLAEDPATRSTTSVCLKIVDPRVTTMAEAALMGGLAAQLPVPGVADLDWVGRGQPLVAPQA